MERNYRGRLVQGEVRRRPQGGRSGHYYRGGYDFDFLTDLDPRLECPICLLCQRDPQQTSCGHRFCYSCIMAWLDEGRTCPEDNCSLGEGDIFPDTLANREILQLRVRCSNCRAQLTVGEYETHLTSGCSGSPPRVPPVPSSVVESCTCPDCGELLPQDNSGSRHQSLVCPNTQVACTFASIGCSQLMARKDLKSHLSNQTVAHMQLLAGKLAKLQQSHQVEAVVSGGLEEESPHHSLPTSPVPLDRDQTVRLSGSNLHNNSKLIRELYQRIVSLEQRNRQQEIKLTQFEQHLAKPEASEMEGRYCMGTFVWKLRGFSSLHQKMRDCDGFVVYSHGFYSSVFGYKMCLRSNISLAEDGEEHLGIFLHLMRGDNDTCLTWPFVGRVNLTLFNQREGILRENFTESMDTMPGLAAFERPDCERNSRGFGFQEFIRVNALYTSGFVIAENEDTLVIKVNVKCSGE